MSRLLLIYTIVLCVFGLGIGVVLHHGHDLQRKDGSALAHLGPSLSPTEERPNHSEVSSDSIWADLKANGQRPLSRLFIQLILIVLTARGIGHLFTRMGQPAVVGEMIAGVLLGPSFLGWLWPDAFNVIFPKISLETPRLLSQLGVCLFLFVQGMELDVNHLKQRVSSAILVSHVSIVFPYFLGVTTALFVFSDLAGPEASFTAFALFMGIAMSITAFPVLARIIEERHLTGTALGSIALTCAAVDDVTAWTMLALIVAAIEAGNMPAAFLCIAVLLAFVALMVLGVKRWLARWLADVGDVESRPRFGLMTCVLAFVFASALVTQVAGIHALFGSFLAGIVMPRDGKVSDYLKVRIEHFSSVFLLPVFFAYTGLRTQVGLLDDGADWLLCVGLIGVATFGKLGGSLLAARLTGMGWRDSFSLGALMNTRGLMELIALNIGYDMGILSPQIFTMLVVMALVTTFLTGPLLMLARIGSAKEKIAIATDRA